MMTANLAARIAFCAILAVFISLPAISASAAERQKVAVRVTILKAPSNGVLAFRRGAKSYQASVPASLKVVSGTRELLISDLAPGDLIKIQGWRESDGTITLEGIELVQSAGSAAPRCIGTALVLDRDHHIFQLSQETGTQSVDASRCQFIRGGAPGDFLDLREGDMVRVIGSFGPGGLVAQRVDILPREPDSKGQKAGRVTHIDYRARCFTLQVGNQETEVYAQPGTVVLRQGVAIAFEDLNEGDSVRVTGAAPNSGIVVAHFVQIG